MNLGTQLEIGTVQKGLRELNPDISFDAPLNRPGDYHFLFAPSDQQGRDIQRAGRGSIYYKGSYVASIDRGIIPEFRIWSSKEGVEEIRMADILKHDDSKVIYAEINSKSEAYNYALTLAERGDDNYQIVNGKVFRFQAVRFTKVKDKVLRLGWRHTFERLIARTIPGITRKSLALKFAVDMRPIPVDYDRLVTDLDDTVRVNDATDTRRIAVERG